MSTVRRVVGQGPLIAAVLAIGWTVPAVAASRTTSLSMSCDAERGEVVNVKAVAAEMTVVLEDGRTVLPAGVDLARATSSSPGLAKDARGRLDQWLAGRPAVLRPVDASPDRWGRTRALLFAAVEPAVPSDTAQPSLSLSLALVDAGLARAQAEPDLHACWPSLLAAEHAARAAGLGLWADPFYAVRDAGDAAQLAGASGGMALVQGQVTRVGRGRSRIYVGMGGGAADFTLRLAKRDIGLLSDVGLGADRLIGSILLVRGFLDNRFGASIEVTSPDQIEVVQGAARGHNATEAILR